MGVLCLVLGYSGSGKSTSLRNFSPDEVGVFNVASKPLPFRGQLPRIDAPGYEVIKQTLRANHKRTYVIDDANYLMAFQNFSRAKESGYGKYTDMAVDFEKLLECAARETSQDTVVFFLMHPDTDDSGRVKVKTIGRMLDNQLTVEGMFPIVLLADHGDKSYWFWTRDPGCSPVKTPMGMFDAERIDNDLKAVDTAIREYWGLGKHDDAGKEDGASEG